MPYSQTAICSISSLQDRNTFNKLNIFRYRQYLLSGTGNRGKRGSLETST
jgi:hypothetical protein